MLMFITGKDQLENNTTLISWLKVLVGYNGDVRIEAYSVVGPCGELIWIRVSSSILET